FLRCRTGEFRTRAQRGTCANRRGSSQPGYTSAKRAGWSQWPCTARVLAHFLLSFARCAFKQERTTMSPSFIWARQYLATSRAQPELCFSAAVWADATAVTPSSGRSDKTTAAKRIIGALHRVRVKSACIDGNLSANIPRI